MCGQVGRVGTSLLRTLSILILLAALLRGQCPWPRSPQHAPLHSDCVCGYSNVRRLSVQCSPVANFSELLEVLNSASVQRLPIDLLYLNNVTGLHVLPRNAFRQLDIQQIHLANTRLDSIERAAFSGLETRLVSLTLQNTGLKEIPLAELSSLRALRTLDLSNNRIRHIKSNAFKELSQLSTLRFAFNADLKLDKDVFKGVERTLKNLNLKGIGFKTIPDAIRNLNELAFLDLAQNRITDIEPGLFGNLYSLTALSLERNLIRSIHPQTFVGLNDSLSSLSLLNNLLTDFPQAALSKLTGLRVLDLGFNGIRHLGNEAFANNKLLTLLALDGNPLKTLSIHTFAHLNSTLRGLSFGGKQFDCDCNVKWLSQWSRDYSLQVTSRERNPQFCAFPSHLRNKVFTQIDPEDFTCPPAYHDKPIITKKTSVLATSTSTTTLAPTTISTLPSTQSITTRRSRIRPSRLPSIKPVTGFIQVSMPQENEKRREHLQPTTPRTTEASPTTTLPTTSTTSKATPVVESSEFDPRTFESKRQGGKASKSKNNKEQPKHQDHQSSSLRLTQVYYHNESIHLRWSTVKPSRAGYQIVYRYFGSKEYHRSDQLSGGHETIMSHTLRDYIAPNELLVVCVLDLDEPVDAIIDEKEQTLAIPGQQCRDISTKDTPSSTSLPPILITKLGPSRSANNTSASSLDTLSNLSLSNLLPAFNRLNELDKIVIAISAAVCVFIIVAVLVFSCCFYRSMAKDSSLRTLATSAGCFSSKSLSPLAKSALDRHNSEWETMSVYSTRSIPRARLPSGTMRSHVSGGGGAIAGTQQRYFNILGCTLPSKGSGDHGRWLDSYMHHYPSVSNLPAISYGTHVTATGGGVPFNFVSDPGNLRSLGRPIMPDRSKPRNRSRSRSRAVHNKQQSSYLGGVVANGLHPPPEFRIHSKVPSSNGSSGHRLLLSSSSNNSNSLHSNNDYDSDWNGSGPGGVGLSTPLTHFGGTHTVGSRATTTINSHRMAENEVDIYVDQNYVKRFNQ